MSKPKLKAKGKAKPAPKSADNLGKSIMESAQQIWLAGLGAFAKAQEEGTKLFDTLVREGVSLEQKTRKLALGKADEVRDAVETGVSQVKERTQETWDKLEKVFEDRVSKALGKLGVPGRRELNEIAERVEELSREVRKLKPGRSAAAAAPAAKPAAPKAKRQPKAKPAPTAE
ncbi:phasin family protein [Tahibacter harae]|uniref:Phasin family protein n=1 Tax=Tahibacter harae TaxID=2963937 RepID=A0ABT1QVY7_9GAMM|nr:phasin family protein [Tahibacter harae]MCQ4166454.1 phasin family protein [Tahibacter harae]